MKTKIVLQTIILAILPNSIYYLHIYDGVKQQAGDAEDCSGTLILRM